MPGLPKAKVTSTRFNQGKAFCIKLWNAVRFALLNLKDYRQVDLTSEELQLEDRWILSRLSVSIQQTTRLLQAYQPSAAIGYAREFFWSEFCDWYLEVIKPRIKNATTRNLVQSLLAFIIDRILRLFHPFVPYITEALWERLNEQAPTREFIPGKKADALLINADWPAFEKNRIDSDSEETFQLLQNIVRSMRDLKSQYQVSPRKVVKAMVKAPRDQVSVLRSFSEYFRTLAFVQVTDIGPDIIAPPHSAVSIVSKIEVYLLGLIDPEKEIAKLDKKRMELENRLQQTDRKLSSENFLQKAPPAVVSAEKKKKEDLLVSIEKVTLHLRKLKTVE
jgi:valyl-tRNA synthetase